MKMNKKGFTLIELVATIALLAIISIISFVSINGVINQSKVNDCESLERNIKSAAKEYVSDNRYEDNFDEDDDKIEIININKLIDAHYLLEKIVNPFDNSKNVDGDEIEIKISLNEDYSADSVSIYKKSDNSIYSCNKGWWNFS